MDTDKIYVGIINHYVPIKHYGHIVYTNDEIKQESIWFRSSFNPFATKKQRWLTGDIVHFIIIPECNTEYPESHMAKIIDYVGNHKLEELRKKVIDSNGIISGYIKDYNGTLYFKEISSYIQFKVRKQFLNVGYILPDENTLVKGQLTNTEKITSAQVNLIGIDYSEESKRFNENLKGTFKAVVVDINNNTLVIKLKDYNYSGIINFRKGENTYQVGNLIIVWVKKISGNNIQFGTVF